jgi:hypothetical protein
MKQLVFRQLQTTVVLTHTQSSVSSKYFDSEGADENIFLNTVVQVLYVTCGSNRQAKKSMRLKTFIILFFSLCVFF